MFVPNRKVKKVIVSCDCTNTIISRLKEFNINVIKTLKNPDLPEGLSTHADLQICFIENYAITAPFAYEYYKDLLPDYNVVKGNNKVQGAYPNDISYNILTSKKRLIHNLKYTDKKILQVCSDIDYSIYNVNQGYTKCTVCMVNENAVITEDEGVKNTLKESGFDVLLIDSGDVVLKGYKNGFLGGASGLIDKDTLCFFGDITKHSNYAEIHDFAEKYGVSLISLSNETLVDYGSIIPIF